MADTVGVHAEVVVNETAMIHKHLANRIHTENISRWPLHSNDVFVFAVLLQTFHPCAVHFLEKKEGTAEEIEKYCTTHLLRLHRIILSTLISTLFFSPRGSGEGWE